MRAASLPRRRDLLTFRLGQRVAADSVCPPAADHWLRVYRGAMACRFEVTLSGEEAHAIPAAREALLEADRLEAALSVFRESSDLMRVNRTAAGAPAPVDRELFALLQHCQALHVATDGAFDITSTPLSRCWGFLRREGRVPSDHEIAAARACVGMALVALIDAIEPDPEPDCEPGFGTADPTYAADACGRTREQPSQDAAGAVRFAHEGVALNLGSIGKGYAVQRIAARLRRRGLRHALVSAGGSSIAAIGGPDSNPDSSGSDAGWPIHIRPTPHQPDECPEAAETEPVARVWLRDGALATSGAGEQFVEVDGRRYGHVIDPRTGWPASGTRSATVITRDAADADALATAFLVGGRDLATRYCAAHPQTLAILTDDADPHRPHIIGHYAGARVLAARPAHQPSVPDGTDPVRRGAS